ncbi:hypothetical protein llap_11662 [Limosa lapponica baueri]|uniref:Uncharacterized protein n=1 Tax=Limosa lapponica baueri TaxID=1758121 RepID=A0A2I0TW62_LIMLA|nr:hypothetical protein llap_11662 [Limosa lapponica baueri]
MCNDSDTNPKNQDCPVEMPTDSSEQRSRKNGLFSWQESTSTDHRIGGVRSATVAALGSATGQALHMNIFPEAAKLK